MQDRTLALVTVSDMCFVGCMVDLAFVLDSSGSVENAWLILVNFLKTFVGMLNVRPKAIRIGLVEFGEFFLFYIISIKLHFLFYSFIPDISIAPLLVHYYSEALPSTALSEPTRTRNCE